MSGYRFIEVICCDSDFIDWGSQAGAAHCWFRELADRFQIHTRMHCILKRLGEGSTWLQCRHLVTMTSGAEN
jgi:hypothetical protein